MPAKQFEGYRNYSVKVLLVSDDDIPKITGQPEQVIALTQSLVQHGAMVAKRYFNVGRFEADIFSMPTYQELIAKNEALVEKYTFEMETLDKSQFKIRMLEEAIAECRERHPVTRNVAQANNDEFVKLKDYSARLREEKDSVTRQWSASKDHAKNLEKRIEELTNSTGGPLYLREFNQLTYIVDRPWYKRLWGAVFVGLDDEDKTDEDE